EEIARLAEEIYRRDIRDKVMPQHKGKFLTIDIKSGDYEIDEDDITGNSPCARVGLRALSSAGESATRRTTPLFAGCRKRTRDHWPGRCRAGCHGASDRAGSRGPAVAGGCGARYRLQWVAHLTPGNCPSAVVANPVIEKRTARRRQLD